MKTGGVAFKNFSPIGSHVNEKNKQTKKWSGDNGGEGATHKIWPASMQRLLRNLSLRMTDGQWMMAGDACAMTVTLLT